MIQYAIKVVPPEWNEDLPIPFTRTEHERWHDQIQNGTRVLIFKSAPVNQLVAEGEVRGFFVQPHRWTPTSTDGLPDSLANADYLLPLGVLYTRKADARFSLTEVRAALEDPAFPRDDGEWRELDLDHYQRLIQKFP